MARITTNDGEVTRTVAVRTEAEAVEVMFPGLLSRRFWLGVLVGIFAMAVMDVSDVHLCVGECGNGIDLWGNPN